MAGKLAAALAAVSLTLGSPAFADQSQTQRLPPLDNDPNRCERGFDGNTIGQANGVSDKQLDIRKCNFDGKKLTAVVYGGAFLSDASFKGADMKEAVFTKAYAVGSNFSGADLSNAIIDRTNFSGSDFTGAKFVNAVITGADFTDTILTDTNFEDALIGGEDVKRMCRNPTLVDESRLGVGCRE